MGISRDPVDPETEYVIERSETPVDEDGYKLGEPCRFVCPHCGAFCWLTEEPTPGWDAMTHPDWCPNERAPGAGD